MHNEVWSGNLKGTNNSEYTEVDEEILLKQMLKET
jgi:hypothetical protein